MPSLPDQIGELRSSFIQELKEISNSKDLENLKVKYLGKKGPVAALMQELRHCSSEERPHFGKLINDLKEELLSHCDNSLTRLKQQEMETQFEQEWLDPTLPGRHSFLGRAHPIQQMLKRTLDILIGMGFSIQLGPDVDTDYYNFEGLNFAPDHPARDLQDTFYLSHKFLLRTHTSNVQVHVMENNTPPIRVVAPGRCFRNEDISARSHVFFHQVEGFYIDKHVTFADLLSTMDDFLSKLLGEKVEREAQRKASYLTDAEGTSAHYRSGESPSLKEGVLQTRFRPSYFPFVEPGMEVDVRCTACKGHGCRLCKHTGWLEILGAGMVHPNVLKKANIDPETYSGYAWGMGIERLAILQGDIPDIRLFTENDLRFLAQFP